MGFMPEKDLVASIGAESIRVATLSIHHALSWVCLKKLLTEERVGRMRWRGRRGGVVLLICNAY